MIKLTYARAEVEFIYAELITRNQMLAPYREVIRVEDLPTNTRCGVEGVLTVMVKCSKDQCTAVNVKEIPNLEKSHHKSRAHKSL